MSTEALGCPESPDVPLRPAIIVMPAAASVHSPLGSRLGGTNLDSYRAGIKLFPFSGTVL